MKKEFIVAKIEASTDGSPYIYVSFKDPNEYLKSGDKQMNPFGSNVMAFNSPEDLMKNLPKAMSNISNMFGGGAVSDSWSGRTTTPSSLIHPATSSPETGSKTGLASS